MRNILILIFINLCTVAGFASLPLEVSMLKVINSSDHILTVKVVGVDMVDSDGKQVKNLKEGTGPGLENVIRLICEVSEIHKTNSSSVPSEIKVPLDSHMHYSLGQIKKAYKGSSHPMLVVLKGENYIPAYAGIFQYRLTELETLIFLYNHKEEYNKSLNQDATSVAPIS